MGKRRKQVTIITLGCPKNEVDSEYLAGGLTSNDIDITDNIDKADAVCINTCGFIEDAVKESIDVILQTAELKKKKRFELYVWGCLPERFRDKIQNEIPEVDCFTGIDSQKEIVRRILGNRSWINEEIKCRYNLSNLCHTAYLKIAEGCNHACSFCTIPLIKGRYHSRNPAEVINEAVALSKKGFRELVLVAQDTTAYGQDLRDGSNLIELLGELEKIDGVRWIRIMYGYPARVTDALMDKIASSEKICRYLDLPLQHISDAILKKMGRNTQKKSIVHLMESLRDRMPDMAIRTTFIVGFPGEEESHFEELVEFVREVRFDRMGVFMFSPEEGTRAFKMKSKVPEEITEMRYHRLMRVQKEIAKEKNTALENHMIPVMIDTYDRKQNLFAGRSEWDAPEIDQTVWVPNDDNIGPENWIGEIVTVRIMGSSAYDLVGKPVI